MTADDVEQLQLALAAHDRGEPAQPRRRWLGARRMLGLPLVLEKGTMPKCGSTRGKTGLIISCGPKSSDLLGLRGRSRSVSILTR
jgi:hypothetical protein